MGSSKSKASSTSPRDRAVFATGPSSGSLRRRLACNRRRQPRDSQDRSRSPRRRPPSNNAPSMHLRAQKWNFASLPPLRGRREAQRRCATGADSLTGNFVLQLLGSTTGQELALGSEITGSIHGTLIGSDPTGPRSSLASSFDMGGLVSEDGSLIFQAGAVELRSAPHQGSTLVHNHGGHLDLTGTNSETGERHSWRFYVVIAADEDATWVAPQDQFLAFLMGTHSRLGAHSLISQLDKSVLRRVRAFVRRAPVWSELEASVEAAGLRIQTTRRHRTFEDYYSNLIPKRLVNEYRSFLDLKVAHADWHSKELSPPVSEHQGLRLIDEVWHLHIAMDCYEEDCMLLSGGHVITHQPVLADVAEARYQHTYNLHVERCLEEDLEVDYCCWPDPEWIKRSRRRRRRQADLIGDGGCG